MEQVAPTRPRRLVGLEVSPGSPGSETRIVYDPHRERYLRLSRDAATLLEALDGSRDAGELAVQLGPPFTAETIGDAVARLQAAGLLESSSRPVAARGRIVYRPPLTIQLTLFDRLAALDRLRPLGRVLFGRTGTAVTAGLVGAGALACALRPELLVDALARPVPLAVSVAAIAGLLLLTSLHELSHALMLATAGGRPRRLGVMLFYLSPVLFCDVSDAWRLPGPGDRRRVTLAGVRVNFAGAGGLAVGAALTGPGQLGTGLMLTAVASVGIGVLNLVPFVKLDGYLALMSQLDLPGLRDSCLDDARAVLVRAILGGRRPEPRLPRRWWAIPFGLACMVCPVVLVVLALERYVSLLLQLGRGGAALWLGVLAVVAVLAADRGRRLLLRARAQGARPARMGAGIGGIALVATAALLAPVAPTARAGWEAAGSRVWIADPVSWGQQLPAGSQVQLETQGALVQPAAGSAVVGERAPDGSVRVGAITPVEGDVAIPARRYVAQNVTRRPGAPQQGVATVRLSPRPLGAAIADAWVGRPIRELLQ